MPRLTKYTCWLLFILILSNSQSFLAQDITPELPPPTETATLEPSPEILPETATSTATETATATLEPTAEITEIVLPTAEITAEQTEAVLSTQTEISDIATATSTSEITAIPPLEITEEITVVESIATTAIPASTQNVPYINPVPDIVVQHVEDFEDNTVDSSMWTVNADYSIIQTGEGHALQLGGGELPLVYADGDIDNFALSVDIWMETEIFQIEFRHSAEGSYKATFAPSGQVQLYRGTELLQTANIAPVTTGAWYTVQIAAFYDGLHLNINGQDIFGFSDWGTLFTGSIVLGSGRSSANPIVLDRLSWRTRQLLTSAAPLESQQEIIVFQTGGIPVNSLQGLIDGINDCNNGTGSGEIELETSISIFESYTENGEPVMFNGPMGLPPIQCNLIIRRSPLVSNPIIISGDADTNDPYRIFMVDELGSLTLENVIVEGGYTEFTGGGIVVYGELILNTVTISDNDAWFGGGVHVFFGTLTTSNGIIEANRLHLPSFATQHGFGAGIYITWSTVNINGIRILDNGDAQTVLYGGGVFNSSDDTYGNVLSITNAIISGNEATYAGGIYNNGSGTVNIQNSIIQHNIATQSGGAIYHGGSGDVSITYGCIVGNTNNSWEISIFASNSITATNNWWGAMTGPDIDGTGSGDAIVGNVLWQPLLESAPTINGQLCDTNPLPSWGNNPIPITFEQVLPPMENPEQYGGRCPVQGEPDYGTRRFRLPCAVIAYNNYQTNIATNGVEMTWGHYVALIMYSEGNTILLGYIENGVLLYNNPQLSDSDLDAVCWRAVTSDGVTVTWVNGADQCASGIQRHFAWAVVELLFKECADAMGYTNYGRGTTNPYNGSCTQAGLVAYLQQAEGLFKDPNASNFDPYLYLQRANDELSLWGLEIDPVNPDSRKYGDCPCIWGNVDGPVNTGQPSDPRYGRYTQGGFSWSYFDDPDRLAGYQYFRVE
jgi:hypothetical protein